MSVRDFFDNNGGGDYGWNNNGKKGGSPFGHFVGQLVIAGLIFACVFTFPIPTILYSSFTTPETVLVPPRSIPI